MTARFVEDDTAKSITDDHRHLARGTVRCIQFDQSLLRGALSELSRVMFCVKLPTPKRARGFISTRLLTAILRHRSGGDATVMSYILCVQTIRIKDLDSLLMLEDSPNKLGDLFVFCTRSAYGS